MVKGDQRKGVLLNGLSLRWWGKEEDMLEENEGMGSRIRLIRDAQAFAMIRVKERWLLRWLLTVFQGQIERRFSQILTIR